MNFEDFKPLTQTLRYGSFSQVQLVELFTEIAGRVCGLSIPKDLRSDISDCDEALRDSLDDLEAREAQHEPLEAV